MESLERRKDAMIAALWSNSNYDDDKGTRKQAIEEIEGNYDEAVTKILSGNSQQEANEEEIDEDNPFFAAAKRGMKKLEQPRNDEGNVADVVGEDYTKSIDQG